MTIPVAKRRFLRARGMPDNVLLDLHQFGTANYNLDTSSSVLVYVAAWINSASDH